MSDKRLTIGELKQQIRKIQDYYKFSDNTEIIVRVNEGREYIDIDGEIIKVIKINDIIKISHVYKIEVHGKDVLWINDNNIIIGLDDINKFEIW